MGLSGMFSINFHHHHHYHFIFKTSDMSKSIQIKAGTTRQETALTVVLGIHITRVLHTIVNKAKHTIYEKHKIDRNILIDITWQNVPINWNWIFEDAN